MGYFIKSEGFNRKNDKDLYAAQGQSAVISELKNNEKYFIEEKNVIGQYFFVLT